MATTLNIKLKSKKSKNIASSSDDDEDMDLNAYTNDEMIEKNDDEKELETIVFGSESCLISNIDRVQLKKKIKKKKNNKQSIKKLKTGEHGKSDGDDDDDDKDESNYMKRPQQIADYFQTRKPAWQDTADDEIVDLNRFDHFKSVVGDKIESGIDKITSGQIEESLKARFSKFYGTPMWADLDDETKKNKKKKQVKRKPKVLRVLNDGEEENEKTESESDETASSDNDDVNERETMLQSTGNFLSSKNKTSSLPKTNLEIKACTDANKEEPHRARLKSVEFHPSARVMLTAGLNQTLSLFQIDGKKNPKIQTIFIDKFPILAAHFTRHTGDEIILGSRHKSFYYYDMNAGKMVNVTPPVKALDEYQRRSISANFEISPDNRFIAFIGTQGHIHLFSVKSKEWIDTLKINDSCNAIAFSPDTRYLFAFGDDKDVHIFDLNDRGHRSLHKFTDYGCLSGTSIAVSNNSQFLATGCKSGIVNIYNLNDSLLNVTRNPKPIKSFMNLTTPCTALKFNSTSEILAASSSYYEDACKLIHMGSLSVFSNFPLRNDSSSTPMRIPLCMDFSLNSGYFTIGNHKGNALLYRLKHYASF